MTSRLVEAKALICDLEEENVGVINLARSYASLTKENKHNNNKNPSIFCLFLESQPWVGSFVAVSFVAKSFMFAETYKKGNRQATDTCKLLLRSIHCEVWLL